MIFAGRAGVWGAERRCVGVPRVCCVCRGGRLLLLHPTYHAQITGAVPPHRGRSCLHLGAAVSQGRGVLLSVSLSNVSLVPDCMYGFHDVVVKQWLLIMMHDASFWRVQNVPSYFLSSSHWLRLTTVIIHGCDWYGILHGDCLGRRVVYSNSYLQVYYLVVFPHAAWVVVGFIHHFS